MLADYYTTIKALHLIAIIAWMAGLLYLPRLFVYHVSAKPQGELDQTLSIMEKRLLRFIMNPAMIASFILGYFLLKITHAGMDGSSYWMHAKWTCILGLAVTHGLLARHRKQFERGMNQKSERYFRILNEVPTLFMVAIIFLVVVKPF